MREFELLWYLITTRPRVASRESILERVWGLSSDVETRTVDVHIRALRSKLESEMVETVIPLKAALNKAGNGQVVVKVSNWTQTTT